MARLTITDIDLPPDAFAVVMATGILSVAAHDHQYPRLDVAFAVLAAVSFAVLAVGLVIRVLSRPSSALRRLGDPDVALRLFTAVAACTVLGARFPSHPAAVWGLGAAALAAWLLLTPVAARDVATRPRAELRDHAHGAWLLPSVATSGLAVTAADLAIRPRSSALLVVGLAALFLALLVYLTVTWLIAWRALSVPFVPEEVTPDSWILMGALAIATLAGAHLVDTARRTGAAPWLLSIARPVTLVAWALAGLWIPVLLYAEVWRVDRRAGSLHYAGVWWSAVFPLGMFSAATHSTALALHMHALRTVSLVFFWIATTVWLVVAVGWAQLAFSGSQGPPRQ